MGTFSTEYFQNNTLGWIKVILNITIDMHVHKTNKRTA